MGYSNGIGGFPVAPSELLHVEAKAPVIEVGQAADIPVFSVSHKGVDLPDVLIGWRPARPW